MQKSGSLFSPSTDKAPVKVPINYGLEGFVGLNIPIQKNEKSETEKTTQILPDEPVYVNYQTIDDYVRAESFGDTTADISEDSEHEILDDQSEDDIDQVTELVDHITVRNAEEAEMYSQRKKIAERLLQKEQKYLYYLYCLEKIYNAFSNNSKTRKRLTKASYT